MNKKYPLNQVFDLAVELCGVPYHELMSSGRHEHVVRARERVVAACRTYSIASYPAISRKLGKTKSHSTAFHAFQRFSDHEWLRLFGAALNPAADTAGTMADEDVLVELYRGSRAQFSCRVAAACHRAYEVMVSQMKEKP